ncbi:MAG: TIR domain-containing protein [Dechloromonas sp.]|nr:MAG: TIR domain-containing protein [Dechloromonas sp.]
MKPLSLFYSYSHRDEAFREELEAHLAYLRRGKLIAEWHDRMIGAGDEWKQQIDHSLATADIVLLLVSADFIASDYCWGEEMTKALARHERGEARVIPVILRPCRWERTPLGRLQAVPKNARPVSEWPNRDAAFEDIASAIERTVEEWGEERLRAAGQAQREADEARQRAEAEAARLGEQQRRQAEEEHQRLEAQARREAEQARQRAELDAKRKAELGHKRSEAQSGPEKSERVKCPAVPEVPVPWGRFAVIGLAVAVGLALFWLAVTREPKKVPARPAAEPR